MSRWLQHLAPRFAVGVLLGLAVTGCRGPVATNDTSPSPRPTLRIAAAASLNEVVEAVTARFSELEGGPRIELNVAGSNTLARQLEAAPVADVFLSADQNWVQYLVARGRAIESTQRPLFGNRLVVVARADSPLATGCCDSPGQLASLEFRHLVIADPDAVPAGRYARARLRDEPVGSTTLWSQVQDRVVPALDVRAALGLVLSDPARLGIVYGTDARTTDEVTVLVDLEPRARHEISYFGVVLEDDRRAAEVGTLARQFLAYFDHPEIQHLVERYGFESLAGPAR